MAGVQHLSMRVPWRDRPWDQFICDDPLGNSSCTLLAAIGKGRDDSYESQRAAQSIDSLDHDRLPCLSERATFMSPVGYTVVKHHPYANNQALTGMLHDTAVSLPGYAFEAVPFRWLNRQSLIEEIGLERVPRFNQSAEDAADSKLKYEPPWVMDGDNQRAVLEAFYEEVTPAESLVFMYLKHSPLQEERNDRLLVGAARITGLTPPRMWKQSGNPPFRSSMWETIVEHSLRPDMKSGILLPYQELLPLLDSGTDVAGALAWAPEGRAAEFSYVTEHLSDDAAIEALGSIQAAAQKMGELGIEVPEEGLAWVDAEVERLWHIRGPVPGLPGVLKVIGVQRPYRAARAVLSACQEGSDPWDLLGSVFADPSSAPVEVQTHIGRLQARVWKRLSTQRQAVLRLLSGFDITAAQVQVLMEGSAEIPLEPEELLLNPYFASTCTYAMPEHIPFLTVDRALLPPDYVDWKPPIPQEVSLEGHIDRRRVEALLTDVLERQGIEGDTLLPVGEAVALANAVPLTRPPNLTMAILAGLDLDADGVSDWPEWSPLTISALADGTPSYKLVRFETTSQTIRDWVLNQQSRPRLGAIAEARKVLDQSLDTNRAITSAPADELEELARTEKAAGLSALHDSPLSVLIGPAGTGKTTLLKALVQYPGVAEGNVVLLAPTGKARVQLETKVGLPAKTLAAHLIPTGRYDPDTGRYLVGDKDTPRGIYSLVVIDEASMLTEEMLAATLDSIAAAKRLILVGDPQQLPPIGAGRPFVDLVNRLKPASFSDGTRVASGYVELQIPRRQLPDGSAGIRHDLQLAAFYGGHTRGAGDDSIWVDLAENPDLPTVKYVPWGDRSAVDALVDELARHLHLDSAADETRAFAVSYGAVVSGTYLNWNLGAGQHAEDWQILSPTRSRSFGTGELNRQIKRSFRVSDTKWAQRNTPRGNIPKPIGPELIVRGDKVMQTINRRMGAWPKDGALNYVANGEIGVAIGFVTPASKRSKNSLQLNVEFSSQPGYQYSYWPSDSDDVLLELAWAVTVHKSQGSEFGTTFLVLPARASVSRELMYTALTRQKDRVVILHEGTLSDLRELAQPWRSATARRLTDLFAPPEPVELTIRGESRRYDRNLLHVSASGIPMASKNEVIIAGLLDQLAPGNWQYEEPLTGAGGRTVLPDFTIAAADGRTVFWEHAGMLDLPDYARKWELKKAWYADSGILVHEQGGGPRGTLLWTDDLDGANAKAWLEQAAKVLGVAPPGGAISPSTRTSGRVSKKAAAPRRGR